MAEEETNLLQGWRQSLTDTLLDFRLWFTALALTLGWIALTAKMQINFPLIGPFFGFLREKTILLGPALQTFLWILIGILVYNLIISLMVGELSLLTSWWQRIRLVVSLVIIVGLIIMAIYFMPKFLPDYFKASSLQAIIPLR